MNDYIKSDLMRYYGKYDMITFLHAYLRNRTFRFQCAFRLCNSNGLSKIIGFFYGASIGQRLLYSYHEPLR